MTTEFAASNGHKIVRQHDDRLAIFDPRGTIDRGVRASLTAALREYFQHERDQELGRWRSKNHPDYVVHALPDQPGAIDITNERSTASHRCFEDCSHLGVDTFKWGAVKDEYFAAHPEPKPWHDAKPGEAWAIEFKYEGLEESRLALVIGVGNSPFEVHAQGESPTVWVNRKDPRITAGRRIWPEETNDE